METWLRFKQQTLEQQNRESQNQFLLISISVFAQIYFVVFVYLPFHVSFCQQYKNAENFWVRVKQRIYFPLFSALLPTYPDLT